MDRRRSSRSSRLWRALLVVAVISSALPVTASAWSRGDLYSRWDGAKPDPCPEVFFMGARGSAQKDLAPQQTDPQLGMGQQSDLLFRLYAGKMIDHRATDVDRRIAIAPVGLPRVGNPGYPAVAAPGPGGSTPARYNASVSQGVSQLLGDLDSLGRRCATPTRFVLGGFSQGAEVVHLALNRITSDLIRSRIAAVVLIGDPRCGGKQTGVRYFGSGCRGPRGASNVPGWASAKTAQVCKYTDRLCNSASHGHATYDTNALTGVATWAAAKTPALSGTPQCDGRIATHFGTDAANKITGTSGRDIIVGRGGNDHIDGRGGDDLICGNAGNDTLVGGTGSDTCYGGADADTYNGCDAFHEPEATAISSGWAHACALTPEGAVECWGRNVDGQVGDGTRTTRLNPVEVVGLSAGVKAISAGSDHSCALRVSGAVLCWGLNDHGQLGDGTDTHRLTPVGVTGLSSGVKAISTGAYHSCALTDAGGVKCWGDNDFGQLGDGTGGLGMRRLTPVGVVGLSSAVKAISTGAYHSCALTDAGGVRCWGGNSSGAVGDGTSTDRSQPVGVVGLSSAVRAISAGAFHTCALTSAGALKCWGQNDHGQVGDDTKTTRLKPVGVVGLSSGVKAVSAGVFHSCALLGTGGLRCWGWNRNGALGDGTTMTRVRPVDVVGLSSGASAISAGWLHSCALTSVARVTCWGYNSDGQLGDGTRTDELKPVTFVGF